MNSISKIRNIALVLTATTFITACETATQLNNMRTSDKAAYSCDQIYAAFSAYDADRQSADALLQLSGMMNVEGMAQNAAQVENPSSYYQKAKMAANIALMAQGCQALN